jgi:tetratricopeptide (TPR) repeat protein
VTAKALVLAGAATVMACSGAPLPTDFELAQAREAARDDEGALALYAAIESRCAGGAPLPHDDCALAAVRSAELDEKRERWRDAHAAWRRAAAATHEPARAARSLSRAAQLLAERLHDPDAARALAWQTVARYPDEIASDDALTLAVRLDEKLDWRATDQQLAALYPVVARFDLGDNLLFARAELLRRHDRAAEAIALYDQLAATYPRSSLRDDAWWRAAELLRATGSYDAALSRLRNILGTRRDALITGSYNYLQLDDAQLLMGRIYLDDLHDPARATESFTLLADDYPESVLRDDALFELARARLAAHDHDGACRALARLLRQFPDGNMARAARARVAELGCPVQS